MSGGILGCAGCSEGSGPGIWYAEARDAVPHSSVLRAPPTTRNYSAQKVSSVEVGKF